MPSACTGSAARIRAQKGNSLPWWSELGYWKSKFSLSNHKTKIQLPVFSRSWGHYKIASFVFHILRNSIPEAGRLQGISSNKLWLSNLQDLLWLLDLCIFFDELEQAVPVEGETIHRSLRSVKGEVQLPWSDEDYRFLLLSSSQNQGEKWGREKYCNHLLNDDEFISHELT